MKSGECFALCGTPKLSIAHTRFLQCSKQFSHRRRLCSRGRCQLVMAQNQSGLPDKDRNDGRATAGLFGLKVQTNGDVLKFGVIAIAVAYGFKTGLTLIGVQDLLAGQITTGFVSVASLVAWASTYIFRVGTKGMTYAQQLRDYENEVLKKRYEELSPDELDALREELEEES